MIICIQYLSFRTISKETKGWFFLGLHPVTQWLALVTHGPLEPWEVGQLLGGN